MHAEAYEAMRQLLGRGPGRGARVLDVGSYDVNGTYRPLVEGRGLSLIHISEPTRPY